MRVISGSLSREREREKERERERERVFSKAVVGGQELISRDVKDICELRAEKLSF